MRSGMPSATDTTSSAAFTLEQTIGNTPLVRLSRLGSGNNRIYGKLEGNNPAGSVKDRPAYNMISRAMARGDIRAGDHLVEATSGNTGIALAMVSAVLGLRLSLIMPDNQSEERKQTMRVYGAELILVSREQGMEGARDLAASMAANGEGYLLDQFANPDNPAAHYHGTAPEIWRDTQGAMTHFISSMGTTGTITGSARFFREKNPAIEIIGVQPADNAQIPGIRKWHKDYLPAIYDPSAPSRIELVTQEDAEQTAKQLARREGIFCGVSSGGAMAVALRLDRQLTGATIVSIVCDRGDRYLSTGVFN